MPRDKINQEAGRTMRLPARRLCAATAIGIALATSAWAQDAATEEDAATTGETAEPAAESATEMAPEATEGETVDTGAGAPGVAAGDPAAPEVREIVRESHGDWQIRCAPDGEECFMYQLVLDPEENPVAEFSLVRLPEGAEAAAGATVVTPLGTLLTAGLVLQVDSGEARQYPFSWCVQIGCFSRFGFDDASVAAMKRGSTAQMRLASIAAPEQPLTLDVSLSGFTAAFDSLEPAPE